MKLNRESCTGFFNYPLLHDGCVTFYDSSSTTDFYFALICGAYILHTLLHTVCLITEFAAHEMQRYYKCKEKSNLFPHWMADCICKPLTYFALHISLPLNMYFVSTLPSTKGYKLPWIGRRKPVFLLHNIQLLTMSILGLTLSNTLFQEYRFISSWRQALTL